MGNRAYLAGFATLVLLQVGCANQGLGHPPVPPVLSEQVPAPPASNVTLIWRPGHYLWDGRAYAWAPGAWVDRAGHGTLWQDGFWQRTDGRSVWVPAHWM